MHNHTPIEISKRNSVSPIVPIVSRVWCVSSIFLWQVYLPHILYLHHQAAHNPYPGFSPGLPQLVTAKAHGTQCLVPGWQSPNVRSISPFHVWCSFAHSLFPSVSFSSSTRSLPSPSLSVYFCSVSLVSTVFASCVIPLPGTYTSKH